MLKTKMSKKKKKLKNFEGFRRKKFEAQKPPEGESEAVKRLSEEVREEVMRLILMQKNTLSPQETFERSLREKNYHDSDILRGLPEPYFIDYGSHSQTFITEITDIDEAMNDFREKCRRDYIERGFEGEELNEKVDYKAKPYVYIVHRELDDHERAIFSKQEGITINYKELEPYILMAKKTLSEDHLKTLENLEHLIASDFGKKTRSVEAKKTVLRNLKHKFHTLSLADVFDKNLAVCRHKALMFHCIASLCGLDVLTRRGILRVFNKRGALIEESDHAWNEIEFPDRTIRIYDPTNPIVIGETIAEYQDLEERTLCVFTEESKNNIMPSNRT